MFGESYAESALNLYKSGLLTALSKLEMEAISYYKPQFDDFEECGRLIRSFIHDQQSKLEDVDPTKAQLAISEVSKLFGVQIVFNPQ